MKRKNFHKVMAKNHWSTIFGLDISRPIGLGLSYTSAIKDSIDVVFQGRKIRIEQREKEGEISGVVWDAGVAMLDTLPKFSILSKTNLRILELGSGTGVVGIAAKRFAKDSEVVLSDLESNLDLIRSNVRSNLLAGDHVSVVSIPWGCEDTARKYGIFDVVLCSDTIYETEALPLFLKTLLWMTREGSQVYIAYRRRVDEREIPFFKKLENDFEISVLDPPSSSPEEEKKSSTTGRRNHWHNVYILECQRRRRRKKA